MITESKLTQLKEKKIKHNLQTLNGNEIFKMKCSIVIAFSGCPPTIIVAWTQQHEDEYNEAQWFQILVLSAYLLHQGYNHFRCPRDPMLQKSLCGKALTKHISLSLSIFDAKKTHVHQT